jgi:hypothetical protein
MCTNILLGRYMQFNLWRRRINVDPAKRKYVSDLTKQCFGHWFYLFDQTIVLSLHRLLTPFLSLSIYIYIYIYIYIHTYIHTNAYIHTYIHTYRHLEVNGSRWNHTRTLRPSFFWHIPRRRLAVINRRFGATYRSTFQESSSQRRFPGTLTYAFKLFSV